MKPQRREPRALEVALWIGLAVIALAIFAALWEQSKAWLHRGALNPSNYSITSKG